MKVDSKSFFDVYSAFSININRRLIYCRHDSYIIVKRLIEPKRLYRRNTGNNIGRN